MMYNSDIRDTGSIGAGLVCVTGATGHVGNVLVRELVARRRRVRALVPGFEDGAVLEHLGVEQVPGDVRDFDSLVSAFRGADAVYHLAGIVTVSGGKRRLLMDVNVRGTRNVVRACLEAGVRRLVYTSSVHALEEPGPGIPVRETTGFRPERLFGDYAWSKARASIEVLKGVRQGLDAVMVFPSGIVGPHDYRLSELGTLFLGFARGRMKAYVDGAYDFVDVRDVVDGILSAMENGRTGEGYILSGHRVTVRDMMWVLHEVTGIPVPRFRSPMWLARLGARVSPLWYRLSGDKPLLTRYSLRVLGSNCLVDCGKAVRELGYRCRPFRETVIDTIDWFRSVRMLSLSARGRTG